MTLKEWCIENNREDILKEFIEVCNEIDFDNTIKYNSNNIEYNSNKLAIWQCQVCKRRRYLSVKERISQFSLECSYCNEKIKVLNRARNKGTEKEKDDLIKLLKTSTPEQAIYIYISKLFPDSIRGKKFKWLGHSEFDIFIPSIKLAIEYDGINWHRDKEIEDKRKSKLAQEHKISLFRIREKGLPIISSTDYIYRNEKDYSNIDSAINATIQFINENYHKNIKYIENFDFKSCQKLIHNEMKSQKVKNSICGKWPEIDKYWDYEKNGDIKPEDITISSKILLYAKCPFCHKEVEFRANPSYKYRGQESFAPHFCDERNLYCLKYLKEHYKKYHNTDIQGDSLQQREVRDWKKNIKYVATPNIELQKELKKINIKV